MRKLFSLVLIALFLQQTAICLIAEPSDLAAKSVQQSQSSAAALTDQDVLEMVKARLTTEIIIAKIKASICNFDTSPAELQRLKTETVTDEIIVAMIGALKTGHGTTIEDKAAPLRSPMRRSSR
jgi:hypothetical protein